MARFPAVLPPRTVFSPSARDSGIKMADWLSSFALLAALAVVLALIYTTVVATGRLIAAPLAVGSLVNASLATGATALASAATAMVLGVALAVHGPDRRLALLAMPPALLAVVAVLLQPADDVRIGLIVLAQGVAFAPLLASRFAPAFAVPTATLEALSQFEVSSRRWKILGSSLCRHAPGAFALGVALAVADVLTPVIIAPDLPSLATFLWRTGLSGELAATLAPALGVTIVALIATFLSRKPIERQTGEQLLDGRVVRYAFGAFIASAALLALSTMLFAGLPVIHGGDVVNMLAVIAGTLIATIAMTALHDIEGDWPARIGHAIAAIPPVLLVLIAAIGLNAFLNEVALSLVLGVASAIPAATTVTLRRRLSSANLEAVQMLGGAPRDIIWHRAGTRFLADWFRTLAIVFRTGSVAVAALFSVTLPFSLSLNASFEPGRASAAVLLITALSLGASWLALRTDHSSEDVSC